MMKKANDSLGLIKIGAGIALLTVLTGCVGYVGGGYGGTVVVPGPDVYFWGGDYDRGRDVHVYSQRGVESRAVAHPSGSREASRSAPARPPTSSSARSGNDEHGRKQ
jgi:hypothetical protein